MQSTFALIIFGKTAFSGQLSAFSF